MVTKGSADDIKGSKSDEVQIARDPSVKKVSDFYWTLRVIRCMKV